MVCVPERVKMGLPRMYLSKIACLIDSSSILTVWMESLGLVSCRIKVELYDQFQQLDLVVTEENL